MVLADGLVQMGLALGKVIFGELLHEAQDDVKGAGSFTAGLVEVVQGHVNVSVTGGSGVTSAGTPQPAMALFRVTYREKDAVVKSLPGMRGRVCRES